MIVLIVTTENLNSDMKRCFPCCLSPKLFSPGPLRFIRLLQDDAEHRKEKLEKMQDSDRSTPEWLTRHVSKAKDIENMGTRKYQTTNLPIVNMTNESQKMGLQTQKLFGSIPASLCQGIMGYPEFLFRNSS